MRFLYSYLNNMQRLIKPSKATIGEDKPQTCKIMARPKRVRSVIEGLFARLIPRLVVKSVQLIRDLHNATASIDGDDQSQRGTQLLEIYALEIQMYNETRNFKKLKV
jgi:hypothetical protein